MKCSAFLGLVYNDGPAPTFLRFSVNSGSVNFTQKEWFDDPLVYRERRKVILQKQKAEMSLNIENRMRFDKDFYDNVKKVVEPVQKK
jgi:hypothetical protein